MCVGRAQLIFATIFIKRVLTVLYSYNAENLSILETCENKEHATVHLISNEIALFYLWDSGKNAHVILHCILLNDYISIQ